jgi:predicted XRE-type DNA-binding protein
MLAYQYLALKEIAMARFWIATLFVTVVILILAPAFIWINNHFNDSPEAFDDLDEGALIKLEIKKNLLNELQQWINENHLTNQQIGEKLTVNNKTIANILYQRADRFSIDMLANLLLRAGKHITVSVNHPQLVLKSS